MIRFALALLFVIPSCCQAVGQIELSYSIQKSLVGATAPEILPGGRILMESDSKTSESIVAVIRVTSTERVRVKAQKTLKEFAELIPISQSANSGSTTWKYLLVGEGSYVIDAISATWDRTLDIVVGVEPDPLPPIPPPDPKPPIPPPNPDIPNEYNLGLIAFQNAAKDPTTAKMMAEWYRSGADKLFGIPVLADIKSIMKEIDTKFANKSCKDQATCQQWEKWRTLLYANLIAEQNKRKTFSSQDWYKALNEIAKALEAVK